MRKLAQRSTGAAKEIKMLIDDSGGKRVDEAGIVMKEIVSAIKRAPPCVV